MATPTNRPLVEAVEAAEFAVEAACAYIYGNRRDRDPAVTHLLMTLTRLNGSIVGSDIMRSSYLAGLLSFLGLSDHATQLLDWAAESSESDRLQLQIESLRGALAASSGHATIAIEILERALARAQDADISILKRIRANLAAAYLQAGDIERAAASMNVDLNESTATRVDAHVTVIAALVGLAARVHTAPSAISANLSAFRQLAAVLLSGEGVADAMSLRVLADLASVEFQVAAASERWYEAEKCVEVLETCAQRLSAQYSDEHPQTLAVLAMVGIAELRWALADTSLRRANRALELLAQLAKRSARLFGPLHEVTTWQQIAYARAAFLFARSVPSRRRRRAAIAAAKWTVGNAVVGHPQHHPALIQASQQLDELEVLTARFRAQWRSPHNTTGIRAFREQILLRISFPEPATAFTLIVVAVVGITAGVIGLTIATTALTPSISDVVRSENGPFCCGVEGYGSR